MTPANVKNAVMVEVSKNAEADAQYIWNSVRPVFFGGVSEIIRPFKVAVAMKARLSI